MSKAVSTVTKPISKVAGLAGGVASAPVQGLADPFVQQGFRGKTRSDLNKGAFSIAGADQFTRQAETGRRKAETRSDFASQGTKDLIQQLQAQASGQGPSIAEAQLKAASDRSLAQQLAAAQSLRGGTSTASLQRQLAQQQATAGQELAQQAGIARMQEQQSAQQLLASTLGQEQQLSDQLAQNYLSQGFSISQAQQQAQADLEKLKTQEFLAAQGLSAQGVAGEQQARSQIVGGILGGASQAGAAAASDKNVKKNAKPLAEALESKSKKKISSKDLSDFLDNLKAYSYEYKDKKNGSGEQVSVMAQDLMKSKVGKNMVTKAPDGTLMVDYGKGFGAVVAAQAELNKKLKKLEKKS